MNSYSPYGSTPGREYYYEGDAKYASPSPTPSPRGGFGYETPHQRPATRAHFRGTSGTYDYATPRQPAFSPRYNSDGRYATVNVSQSRSSRKQSFSSPRTKRDRRNSYSYYRASDSHGESDEDEFIEINGVTYVLPAQSKSKRYTRDFQYSHDNTGGYGTNYQYYTQSGYPTFEREPSYSSPRHEPEPQPRRPHTRRASTSGPQRPSTARPATARPSSSHKKQTPPAPRKATDVDAKKHRIPAGYSLKNWDPDEEPITLLGSVFDANSLGKWIYDWTVYHHGPATPISEMAGELWLLQIQVAGKVKRSEECISRIRSQENKEMVEDFIESGERLTDKLRKLLKACETPMLKADKSKKSQLGNNAGVQFVRTMFGRDRELEKTERYMQSVRLWNLRFDANCEEILKKPTM